jgi:hypothetical protein
MRLQNSAAVSATLVETVARKMSVDTYDFILFLDKRVNSIKADQSRAQADYWKARIEEYHSRGWGTHPLSSFEKQNPSPQDDIHACTAHREGLENEQIPEYAKRSIDDSHLLVYIDETTCSKSDQIAFVVTLAHEFRHVWHFFNLPVVFFSQTTLSWVMPPQQTPAELDAEATARSAADGLFGIEVVRAYLEERVQTCPPEHRQTWEMLRVVKQSPVETVEAETIRLLEHYAPDIRRYQEENKFEIPGIRQLAEALKGKSRVSRVVGG